MNILLVALLTLAVTGCATTHNYQAAPQNYRMKNAENPITITGKLDQVLNEFAVSEPLKSKLTVFIDNELKITGFLDKHVSGDIQGEPFNGKPTSASCSTKNISAGIGETRCIVFIDNERTVTLTF